MRVERTREGVRLTIELPRTDIDSLGRALRTLVDEVENLHSLLAVKNFSTEHGELNTLFATSDGKVDERDFFARCAEHGELHPLMLEYVRRLAAGTRGVSFGSDDTLWHTYLYPVGSFAIVPLALRHRRYIPALIDHMRACDLNHESFHGVLVDRLLSNHGICDETIDLLVFRAGDGSGQYSDENLWLAARAHRLCERWQPWGRADGFASRLRATSESLDDDTEDTSLLAYWLHRVGQFLFGIGTPDFTGWLRICERLWNVTIADDESPAYRPTKREAPFTEDDWLAQWNHPLPTWD